MLGVFLLWRFALYRIAAILLLTCVSSWVHAAQISLKSATAAPFVIEALDKGTFTLNGPWQFHPGDDPAWASPAFDSSGWEQISASKPWGRQGHAGLTGFAWYRYAVTVSTPRNQVSGAPGKISLLVPGIRDAYEVYWNGALIGRNGKLTPHYVWYISQPAQALELGQVQDGVLAVRVWKAPLLSDDSDEAGGFDAAPLIGSSDAIATAKAADEFQWLRSRQLHFAANLLCAVIAFMCFLLWLRTPDRWVLLWMTGFAVAQPANLLLLNAHLGLPYTLAMGASQPVCAMQDISFWFLLLWLLSLHGKRAIGYITRTFACIYLGIEVLDGVVVALSWNPQWAELAKVSDAVLTIVSFLFQLFPLALVGCALFQRTQFNAVRWIIASLVIVDEMMLVFSYAVKQGRQFTGWSIADKIDAPLFFLDGNGISLNTLAGILLLSTIVYAVYNSVRGDQRRHEVLELEKLELQHQSHRMRYHAEHDGLTGLWNHRVIVERLGEEMSHSLQDGTPLGVILADIDHFKKINDTFGHLAGDLVLREIGTVFTSTLQPTDSVGRYGGEEFLLILPNCGMESALIRAEQLRVAVQSAQIMDGEIMLKVSASFGVASILPSRLVLPPHHAAEVVIRAIDGALYEAKSSGRNRVIPAGMDTVICTS